MGAKGYALIDSETDKILLSQLHTYLLKSISNGLTDGGLVSIFFINNFKIKNHVKINH